MSDNTFISCMFIWLAVVLIIALSGCTWGPLEISHEDGEVPKVRVNLPADVKVSVKTDEVEFKRTWRF